MRRRTFLKSVVAAYCIPIVTELAPMLMRPVEVVREQLAAGNSDIGAVWAEEDEAMWRMANPAISDAEWAAAGYRPLRVDPADIARLFGVPSQQPSSRIRGIVAEHG